MRRHESPVERLTKERIAAVQPAERLRDLLQQHVGLVECRFESGVRPAHVELVTVVELEHPGRVVVALHEVRQGLRDGAAPGPTQDRLGRVDGAVHVVMALTGRAVDVEQRECGECLRHRDRHRARDRSFFHDVPLDEGHALAA